MAASLQARKAQLTPHHRIQQTLCHRITQTLVRLSCPRCSQQDGVDVLAVLEGAEQPTAAEAATRRRPNSSQGTSSLVNTAGSSSKEAVYRALLAIILKLSSSLAAPGQQQQHQQQQQQQQLEAFLKAQPIATSVPFISWIADLEAKSSGAQKAQLARLCEALLTFREVKDQQQQEQLYLDTIKLLGGGNKQVTALLADEPQQYALALAEGLTGQAVTVQGYSPAYDLLLQVAPVAALTPESVTQGHLLAAELGQELTNRRKSTLAAMLGRTKLTPEQQAQLMGGSPAARICDLLLTLNNSQERIALLPDCFTPPDDAEAQQHAAAAAAAASSSGGQQQQQDEAEEEETEELWCTPMQLLNEIESRLKAAAKITSQQHQQQQRLAGGSSSDKLLGSGLRDYQQQQQQQQQKLLVAGESAGLSEAAAAVEALEELRAVIRQQWLNSLPTAG